MTSTACQAPPEGPASVSSESSPYFDTHVHATQYYCVPHAGPPSELFERVAADRVLLFGSYTNVTNGYWVDGANEDDVALAAQRLFPDRVAVLIMGYTPDNSDRFLQYVSDHLSDGVVGLGEYGFGMTQSKCSSGGPSVWYPIAYPSLEEFGSLTRLLAFAETHRLILHLHTQDFADPRRQIDWGVLDAHRSVQFIAPHVCQFMWGNKEFRSEVEARLLRHCNLFLEFRLEEYKADSGTPNWRSEWSSLLSRYPGRFTIGSDSQPPLASPAGGASDVPLGAREIEDFLVGELGLSREAASRIMYSNAARIVDDRMGFTCGD